MEKSTYVLPAASTSSQPEPRATTVHSSGGRLNSPLEPAGNIRRHRCAAAVPGSGKVAVMSAR